jgi:hypothetical protein
MQAARERLSRRAVVTGAGLVLLSACSDDDEAPAQGNDRRRRRRRRGREDRAEGSGGGRDVTVLGQSDLDEVSSRLTALLDGDDLDAFLTYARPSDSAGWRRMWEGLHTVPTVDRRFHLQSARPEWRNRKGGPVTATMRGVVAYRIEGTDAQPMAHLFDLSVFKSPDGEVRVQALGPVRDPDAAPWLLTKVAAVTAPHVVLISRDVDAAVARDALADVERGAARALDFLPPPAGVSKICVTLGWPRARERLYGGNGGEFVGSAHNYRYVEPQVLADTGTRDSHESFAGSRVVVDPGAMAGQGAEAVSAHESVHALAFQWGPGAPPLYAEGLARWFEIGPGETERAARRLGAQGYRAFARRVTERPGRAAFYNPAWQERNYTGAALTCLYVAREHGEGTLRDLVRAAYEGAADPAREVLGKPQRELLREVAAWLQRQESGSRR